MEKVDKRIHTAKIKLVCAKRWAARHLVLEEIIALYEALLTTLQKIAYSLIKSITDPRFIVALNACSYTLGFTEPLSVMLQATSADIIKA